jgi:tetratricopeptide (TPR) repeat protein
MMVSATGCGRIISYYTRPLLDDLNRSFMSQKDVVLAEQGTPAFLMILDGLIEHSPEDKSLLLSGAKAYSAYASAFVGEKNPERNKILAGKAKEYAFRAFSLNNREFAKAKDKPHPEFVTLLPSLRKKDVPYLYYAATCWAGWIQANSESWDAIADLPKVQSLIKRAIELDEGFYYGASHTFMGVLLTIRPPSLGGRPEEARKHFERAVELGQGKFLPAYVLYAKHYAKPAYKEKLFYDLLDKALDSPVDEVSELILINTLAGRQAGDLINSVRNEEYFK